MKWIKTREKWLNEAKIRDVIFPRQAKEVSYYWAEKYLDYEEVEPTDKIKQGKWKLSDEDRIKVLSAFFECNMGNLIKLFSNLPDKFNTILSESINGNLLPEEDKTVMHELNIQAPTIDQMVFIFNNVFRKLDINQTRATEMIQKDENGRPVRGEDGQMIRVKKSAGDPIFTNNLVNINTFIDDYNRCFPDEKLEIDLTNNRDLNSIRNLAKDNMNPDYKFEFNIFGKDLYLEINHNPKDILNMSISKFYASCQHLYSGGVRERLLSNVFDPNSIPAFFVFDSPIIWGDDKISDKLPLSRMMIRNIETFNNDETKIYFDRAYPDRMKNVFDDMVEKYTEMESNAERYTDYYIFSPDVDTEDINQLSPPYMDRLSMRRATFIGVNTKTLYLSSSYDWSNVKISPKASIKELIIETENIPDNLLNGVDLKLEWIKIKGLKISDIKGFSKLKTNSFAFDKCKFNSDVILSELNQINPDIKRLQFISCDVDDVLNNINLFENLEELQLIYTIDSLEPILDILKEKKLKKLVISGDLASNKSLIQQIRKEGTKIETLGPVI